MDESESREDMKENVEPDTMATTIEDFDVVPAQNMDDAIASNDKDAEPSKPQELVKPETTVESTLMSNGVADLDDDQDDDDVEDITLVEPKTKTRTPPKSTGKKFAEDEELVKPKSHIREEEKAPFQPLSEYLDPDYWDLSDSSEDEGLPDYKIGGYHPVHVGEVFSNRYIII